MLKLLFQRIESVPDEGIKNYYLEIFKKLIFVNPLNNIVNGKIQSVTST